MRKPEFKVDDIFLDRWSPRAISDEPLKREDLMQLFEAAKWAPSSYNNQPWRYLYSLKESQKWNDFFDLLVEFNKSWAKNAGALILVLSKKNFEHNGEFSKTHSFDAGLSVQNLLLQGSLNDLVVHAIEGFDYEKAREKFEIPEEYNIECMLIVGKKGELENLPEELRESETLSDRKKLSQFVFEDKLPDFL